MSTDSRPIVLSSDTDMPDAMSSTAVPSPLHPVSTPVPVVPVFQSQLVAVTQDTEAFSEAEVAPTPHVSPVAPASVLRAPTLSPSHAAPVQLGQTTSSRRHRRFRNARKSVRITTPTPVIPTTPISPSHSVTSAAAPTPTQPSPPEKRARHTPSSLPTETSDPSPTQFHVGESSRAAAARESPTVTLDAQIVDLQRQMDRLALQVDVSVDGRLDTIEEEIEGLVIGRVGIDVSYHGLEARQGQTQERVFQLGHQLSMVWEWFVLVWDHLIRSETREAALQHRVEHLEEVVITMDHEIAYLKGGAGPPGAPGGA